jgi:large subunit ribosomal protein L23
MDLTAYDIIIGPVVSDKAYKLNKNENKVVLRVHKHANAPMIKDAAEKLFGIKVEEVNVLNRKGKLKRTGKKFVKRSGEKKAILTLAEGHTLDLFGQNSGATTESGAELENRND